MNKTEKVQTEVWKRRITEYTEATYDPKQQRFFLYMNDIVGPEGMHELVDFLLECLRTFPPHVHSGDYVRFLGTQTMYTVENTDPNFEGQGLAIAIYMPGTDSIEWFNATMFEKVYPIGLERNSDDRPH